MRALVTGADGFVGPRLIRHLQESGWETVAIDGPPPKDTPWCDLSDVNQIGETLKAAAPFTHLFHLAAITFVPEATQDPATAVDINLSGTMRLVNAMQQVAPEARFIYISTSEVYGPPAYLPVDESHPLHPANPYAITKAGADAWCRFMHKSEELDTVIVRPFNHSGPGQSDRFALSSFARQLAEMEAGKRDPVLSVGNLTAARDFTHVDDVVRAYELIARKGKPGETYNVCSGQAKPIQHALDTLRNMARIDTAVETDPKKMRPVDVPVIRGTAEKLTNETNWRPEKNLDAILTELLNHWRENT